MNRDEVLAAIYRAVDEVNTLAAPDRQLPKSEDTLLLGKGSLLDSMGVVNLIVEVEGQVASTTGASVSLTDPELLEKEDNPLESIGKLADYIVQEIG